MAGKEQPQPQTDREKVIIGVSAKEVNVIFPSNTVTKYHLTNVLRYLKEMECVEDRGKTMVGSYYGRIQVNQYERMFAPEATSDGYKECEALDCPLINKEKPCPLYLESKAMHTKEKKKKEAGKRRKSKR